MKKFAIVLVSIGLGFVAPLVFILGASPFEVQGQSSIKETLGGCVTVVLYIAACQFWLSRKGGGFRAAWPIMVGMVGSLLATSALLVQGGIFHNWPMVVSGCIGSFAGILLSIRRGSGT
jgi:hypothetical protein